MRSKEIYFYKHCKYAWLWIFCKTRQRNPPDTKTLYKLNVRPKQIGSRKFFIVPNRKNRNHHSQSYFYVGCLRQKTKFWENHFDGLEEESHFLSTWREKFCKCKRHFTRNY